MWCSHGSAHCQLSSQNFSRRTVPCFLPFTHRQTSRARKPTSLEPGFVVSNLFLLAPLHPAGRRPIFFVIAHRRIAELLPTSSRPSANDIYHPSALCDALADDASGSQLTEPYDTPPTTYLSPDAPSTLPESNFLNSLLPIVALGLAAAVPSLLRALILLVLTLRALVAYIRQSRLAK